MENDYLWDKTGEDKEIELLENALKEFRFQSIAPPVLPINALQAEKTSRFSFFENYFKLAFAGFACLLIMFFGFGIWLQISDQNINQVADLSTPIVNPINLENESQQNVNIFQEPKIKQTVVKKVISSKTFSVSKPTKIGFSPKVPRVKTIKPETVANKPIKLTTEEKFAYDQLMLALSITGSKLKEVKDKANGIENSNEIKSFK